MRDMTPVPSAFLSMVADAVDQTDQATSHRADADRPTGGTVYRWASERGAQGMPYPEELAHLGYERIREHPLYPGAWLMRRDG